MRLEVSNVDAGRIATWGAEILTVNHLLDSILVIFAEVDDASVSLAKTIAACTVEEAAAGAQDGLVDRPLAVITGDGKIRVFSTEV